MTQEATQLELPNFEATTDGKKVFTPKQWLELFRQFTKRKYKMDIAELFRREEMTQTDKISIKELIRLFNEYFLPKRNTYHNREEFFWTKQAESESPENFWRRLIEIEKECNFENITAEELLISKFMTAITDKKLRDKLLKEKKPEIKKAIEMIKKNTYEKRNKKNTKPEAIISNREKEIKEEPIQRMDKFNTRPGNKFNNNRSCRFCTAPN